MQTRTDRERNVVLVGSRVSGVGAPDSDYDLLISTEADVTEFREELADELADRASAGARSSSDKAILEQAWIRFLHTVFERPATSSSQLWPVRVRRHVIQEIRPRLGVVQIARVRVAELVDIDRRFGDVIPGAV